MKITMSINENKEFTATSENAEVVKVTKWRNNILSWILKGSFDEIVWDDTKNIQSLKVSYEKYLSNGKSPCGAPKTEKPAEIKVTSCGAPKTEKPAEIKVTSGGKPLKKVKAVVNSQPVLEESAVAEAPSTSKKIEKSYTTEDGDVVTIIAD